MSKKHKAPTAGQKVSGLWATVINWVNSYQIQSVLWMGYNAQKEDVLEGCCTLLTYYLQCSMSCQDNILLWNSVFGSDPWLQWACCQMQEDRYSMMYSLCLFAHACECALSGRTQKVTKIFLKTGSQKLCISVHLSNIYIYLTVHLASPFTMYHAHTFCSHHYWRYTSNMLTNSFSVFPSTKAGFTTSEF